MAQGRRVSRDATVGANLLVALLLRYPAISSARVDTTKKQLQLTFLIADVGSDRASRLQTHLQEMLDAFFTLEAVEPRECRMDYDAYADLGLIHVNRDLESLRQGEIRLIVEAIEELTGSALRTEAAPELIGTQDDLVMQEEWIGYMLENIRTGDEPQSLLAFREGGRVLVLSANGS